MQMQTQTNLCWVDVFSYAAGPMVHIIYLVMAKKMGSLLIERDFLM